MKHEPRSSVNAADWWSADAWPRPPEHQCHYASELQAGETSVISAAGPSSRATLSRRDTTCPTPPLSGRRPERPRSERKSTASVCLSLRHRRVTVGLIEFVRPPASLPAYTQYRPISGYESLLGCRDVTIACRRDPESLFYFRLKNTPAE